MNFVERMVFQLNSLYFNTLEDLDFSKLSEHDIENRKLEQYKNGFNIEIINQKPIENAKVKSKIEIQI